MHTMLSLFDGSGGFPLAAYLCGIEPKYASEVEPYPIAVTQSRFPSMIHLGDVRGINGAKIDPVDVFTFGSPCQDMSIAGKREGIKHTANGDGKTTRSGLFMEAIRIIEEMRAETDGVYPRFAVWENVFGAFSSNKGEDFRLVLQSLIKIVEPASVVPAVPKGGWAYADCWVGDGWGIGWRTFDAQYWGVPQRRRRIYLVADFRGQCAGKVLFEREGMCGNFAASGTPGKGTAKDAPGGAGVCDKPATYTLKIRSGCAGGGKGPLIQENMSATLATNNDQYLFVPVESAGFKAGQGAQARSIGWEMEKTPTLAAEAAGNSIPSVCVAYDARGNGDGKTASTITGDHNNRITDYTTVVCIQGNTIDRNAQQNGIGVDQDVSFTLNSVDRHGIVYCMSHGQAHSEVCKNCSPCLTCNHEKPIVFDKEVYNSGINALGGHYIAEGSPAPTLRVDGHPPGVCVQYIVRRLTPTECCRLQGFPDRWGDIDPLDISDEKEIERWKYIYTVHCILNGLKIRPSILSKPERLKRWHDKLHTDSAEYRMWGNGIALPCALYVMQGISEALENQYGRTMHPNSTCFFCEHYYHADPDTDRCRLDKHEVYFDSPKCGSFVVQRRAFTHVSPASKAPIIDRRGEEGYRRD